MGTTTRKRIPKQASFSITLKLGDEIYTSTGNSIAAALTALQAPQKIVTKGFLTVENGEKRFERMLMPLKMRMFLRPAYRAIQAKQLTAFLK